MTLRRFQDNRLKTMKYIGKRDNSRCTNFIHWV